MYTRGNDLRSRSIARYSPTALAAPVMSPALHIVERSVEQPTAVRVMPVARPMPVSDVNVTPAAKAPSARGCAWTRTSPGARYPTERWVGARSCECSETKCIGLTTTAQGVVHTALLSIRTSHRVSPVDMNIARVAPGGRGPGCIGSGAGGGWSGASSGGIAGTGPGCAAAGAASTLSTKQLRDARMEPPSVPGDLGPRGHRAYSAGGTPAPDREPMGR